MRSKKAPTAGEVKDIQKSLSDFAQEITAIRL